MDQPGRTGSNLLLALLSAGLAHLLVASRDLLPASLGTPLLLLCDASILVNLWLALFNLLPIPPLDGSRILPGLWPARRWAFLETMSRYSFLILIVLFYSGLLNVLAIPAAILYGLIAPPLAATL